MVQPLWKRIAQFLKKLNTYLTVQLNKPVTRFISQEKWTLNVQKETTQVFIAILLIIAKKLETTQMPSNWKNNGLLFREKKGINY